MAKYIYHIPPLENPLECNDLNVISNCSLIARVFTICRFQRIPEHLLVGTLYQNECRKGNRNNMMKNTYRDFHR